MEYTLVLNPRDQKGFFSQLSASWINDVLKLGSKQPLEEKHLLEVETSYQAERLVADLEREWLAEERASEQNRTKPRLWKAMMRVIPYRDYLTVAFFRLFHSIAFNLFPLIVWFFLKSISTSSEISYKATLPFVIGFAVVSFLRTVCSNHGVYKMDMISTKLKVAMTGLVYKKVSNFHQKSGSNKASHERKSSVSFVYDICSWHDNFSFLCLSWRWEKTLVEACHLSPNDKSGRGQRAWVGVGHQTKGLMSEKMAVHVYISLSSSAKQEREMSKF